MIDDRRLEEWQALHKAAEVTCARHGKPRLRQAAGDFMVLGDRDMGVSQRILVFNPRFLTRELVADLSKAIRRLDLLGAQIEVVFDFTEHEKVEAGYLRGLLIVHPNGVDEPVFDLKALRRRFGNGFYH